MDQILDAEPRSRGTLIVSREGWITYTTQMEVSLFPNPRRPGFGLRPRRESQRPLLPQHARHCPVLEAGSALGFMVYPPLAEHELFQAGYEGEGRYQFQYSINATGRKWEPVFAVTYQLPVGGIGATREETSETLMSSGDPGILANSEHDGAHVHCSG